MILFLLVIMVLVLAFYFGQSDSWDGECPSGRNLLSIIFFVIFVATFVALIANCSNNTIRSIDNYEKYQVVNEKISIHEDLYEEKINIIKKALDKYPMEEDMYKGMNLSILLKLPEIQSDKLLKNNIQIAIESRDQVCKLRLEAVDLKKEIRKISNHWLLVPSLYYPIVD